MTPSTSSSDSEDDEEKQKLCQAVDPDFLKRTTAQFGKTATSDATNDKNASSCTVEDAPVSKRAKLFDNAVDNNEFPKPYSLEVTPECQNFIAKQLGKSLDRTIKEVSTTTQILTTSSGEDTGIRLFARSQSRVTEEDLKPRVTSRRKLVKRKKKKRKSVSQEKSSDSSSESESEKLKSVAVSADWVFNSI